MQGSHYLDLSKQSWEEPQVGPSEHGIMESFWDPKRWSDQLLSSPKPKMQAKKTPEEAKMIIEMFKTKSVWKQKQGCRLKSGSVEEGLKFLP